jgi:hypothetical protein
MGSFRRPKAFDPVTILSIRETLYDILNELDEQAVVLSVSEKRLKADIIDQLLYLSTHHTPQDEWKAKVLNTLASRN